MPDFVRPDPEPVADLDRLPAPVFRRVLLACEGADAGRDAIALAETLAGGAETVTGDEDAELIVIASPIDLVAGRESLEETGRRPLEGAPCPVAVAPPGFGDRADREIRRIDVGIDGSRESIVALALAAKLARAHAARLRAVAVAEPSFELGGTPRPVDPRERERLAGHLDHAADGLPGIWVETELSEGLPDQILRGFARDADLLVLGSRSSYGGEGRVSLGNTGERILRASLTPVLLAPAP